MLAALGDPEAAHEPAGLIPSRPSLRPADIFTSAAHGSLAALDIGVCSPEAAGAGLDCCAAMAQRKRQTYEPYFGELRQRGVRYQPVVWSSCGRAHVEALDTLRDLARAAARRRGIPDWQPMLQRTRAAISVELQRRLVCQVRRCLPEEPEDDAPPEAAPPPRTRMAEEEERSASLSADDSAAARFPSVVGDTVADQVAETIPAEEAPPPAPPAAGAPTARSAARGPGWFEALRIVYDNGGALGSARGRAPGSSGAAAA